MNEKNKGKYTLLAQVVISSLVLGWVSYKIYPTIEKNNTLLGTYYVLTTMGSVIMGIIIELTFGWIFNLMKAYSERKVIKSEPTEEYAYVKEEIVRNNKNKAVLDHMNKYQ